MRYIWIFFFTLSSFAAEVQTTEDFFSKKHDSSEIARFMVMINEKVGPKDIRKVIEIYERHVPFSSDSTPISVREMNLDLQVRDPFRLSPEILMKAMNNENGEFRWAIIDAAGRLSLKDKRYYMVLRKGMERGYFDRDYALNAIAGLPKDQAQQFRRSLIKCEKTAMEADHRARCKALLAR
jgi:hypothetical protein